MNLELDSDLRVIYEETMLPRGFLWKLRENEVDEFGFLRLIEGVRNFKDKLKISESINRLLVACLFEVPWEIENTVDHFSNRDRDLGIRVSRMADELRGEIHETLWFGLERYYKDI